MFDFLKKKKNPVSITQQIEMAKYPVIMAPLFGAMIPVQVRQLTSAQIRACGNISLIESFEDRARRKAGKFSRREIVAYAERHREIMKACLVVPTYDELFKSLTAREKQDFENQIKEIDALIKDCPRGPKRQLLEEERDGLRVWVDLILPDDFVSFIVSYALGVDTSDIKKVSEAMLLEAAYLAERGHDNPCDHLPGNFTEFMRDDINMRAWYLLDQKKEEMKHAG
jgi:hypothetical protein